MVSAARLLPATPEGLAPLATALADDPLFERYGLSAVDLQRSWHKALLAKDSLIVAFVADTPCGLAWFCPQAGFATGAYLRLLTVAPAWQNQGLGTDLLNAFEQACAVHTGGLFLLCSDFNRGAQKFYAARGYHQVGQLPGFAAAGVVELIYWKRQPG